MTRSRFWRFLVGLIGIAVTYGLLWFVLLWFQPIRPPHLVIIQEGYETDLTTPTNTHGVNAAGALRQLVNRLQPRSGRAGWFRPPVGFAAPIATTKLHANLDLSDVAQALHLSSLPRGRSTILYLTARLRSVAGKPFLLCESEARSRAEPPRTATYCDLTEFVNKLIARPDHRFCLILDVTPAPAEFPLAVPSFHALAGLESLRPLVEGASNLVVLAPASLAATAVAPRWRQTLFGHHVIEGLTGAAAAGPTDRITAAQLAQYVTTGVAHGFATPDRAAASVLAIGSRRALGADLILPLDASPRGSGPQSRSLEEWSRWTDAAWASYQDLDTSDATPGDARLHPRHVAPLAWARYRDQLLRFDELAATIDPTAQPDEALLGDLRKGLSEAAKTLSNPAELPWVQSSRQSLASAGLPGVKAASLTRVDPALFGQIWTDPQATPPPLPPDADASIYAQLLDRMEQARGRDAFSAASLILERFPEAAHPRPVEAHFLALLLRDQLPSAVADPAYYPAFTTGIRVRRLAEQAALGVATPGAGAPERVAPWVADLVAAADLDRRRGEDYLLGSSLADWETALDSFRAAEKTYQTALDQAQILRDAFDRRDRALADLPYYSAWMSQMPSLETTRRDRSARDRAELLETAWTDAHELAELLIAYPARDERGPLANRRAAIGLASAKLHQDLDRITDDFTTTLGDAKVAADSPAARAEQRARLRALLATPFVPLAQRTSLRTTLSDLGPDPGSNDLPPTLEIEASKAQRAARMALAAIGKTQFERPLEPAPSSGQTGSPPAVPPIESFPAVRERFLAPLGGDSGPMPTSFPLFRAALAQIARVQNDLPGRIKVRPESEVVVDLNAWPSLTAQADLIGRLLLPTQGAAGEPAPLERVRLVQHLLLTQAERSFEDHYFAARPLDLKLTSDDPLTRRDDEYFQHAIATFVADMTRLEDFPTVESRRYGFAEAIKPIRNKQADKRPLVVPAQANRLVLTDQPQVTLQYPIEVNPTTTGSVRGQPVFWFRLEGGSTSERRFKAVESAGNKVATEFAATLPFAGPDLPARDFDLQALVGVDPRSRSIRLEGRFRGQVVQQETAVDLYRQADITVRHDPPPLRASIAVQPDQDLLDRFGRTDGGALAIILDCSGSMGPLPNAPPEAPSKFREITRAVEQILPRIASGTVVSVYIFGQEILTGNPTLPAEETITQIVRPTVWRSDDPGLIRRVMAQIDGPAYRPYNRSPIVKAMLRVRDDLAGTTGFQSMLVLTDGKDTSFEGKPPRSANPAGDVASVLREAFAQSEIEITFVGFKVADSSDDIRKQFGVIETFRRPGQFVLVNDAVSLAQTLNEALRPTLFYRLDSLDNKKVVGPVGIGPRSATGLDFVEVTPGSYRLQLDADTPAEATFHVEPGDNLAIAMKLRAGLVAFERLTWTSGLVSNVHSLLLRNHWRLTTLQNEATAEGGLNLQASLELEPDERERINARDFPHKEAILVRPRAVWLELSTAQSNQPIAGQKWTSRSDWAAPVWAASVPHWPQDEAKALAPPVLRAWWAVDNLVPSLTLALNPDERLDQIRNRRTAVTGLVIESVTVESTPIDRLPNVASSDPYLVIRVRSPAGEPFWVELTGGTAISTEHRFYDGAHRSTGVFGPWNDAVAGTVTGLAFYSLKQFKERAEKQQLTATDLSIRPPTLRDTGPRPLRFVRPGELVTLPDPIGP